MNKCSLDQCNDPIMQGSKVDACKEHEDSIAEFYKEEHEKYLMEQWEDYNAMVLDGIMAGNANNN